MNAILTTIGDDYRLINVTSTTSAQSLGVLVAAALANKSGAAAVMPTGNVMRVSIRGSADLAVSDAYSQDETTITSGTWKTFECTRALDLIRVKNSATVAVEIIFQANPAK